MVYFVDQNRGKTMGRTYLIVGASRGIGQAVAQHLEAKSHRVISVSRTHSVCGEWVQADVSTDTGLDAVFNAVGQDKLDGLLYLGGVWEEHAFTDDYRFQGSSRREIRDVIAVNLVAPIILAQGLAANLAKSGDPRIILIGSVSGLDNTAGKEVANTASKFGLRGAAQALARVLSEDRVGVTVINPGDVGTPEVLHDIEMGLFPERRPIPLSDLPATVDYVLGVSADTTPQEINLMQRDRSR